MLPFEPEPMKSLKARYPAALERVYDYTQEVLPNPTPSSRRCHVFDTEEGLRIIVSRDREAEHDVYLHVSISIRPNYPLYAKVQRIKTDKEFWALLDSLEEVYRQLSGDRDHLAFEGLSPGKKVPHWRRKEPTAKAAS